MTENDYDYDFNLLLERYRVFVDILNDKNDWTQISLQYALQFMYFLHCGNVRLTNDSSFKSFVDKDVKHQRKITDFSFENRRKNVEFNTYHINDGILSNRLDIMHFNFNDIQKINCISYFGLEQGILFKKSLKKKDKKLRTKLTAILDKLRDLDSPHTQNNYINKVR